jgi:hypothetical protein
MAGVTDIQTFSLEGWHDQMDPPLRIFQTVFFHSPVTVTATCAMSVVSIGGDLSAGTAGTAGAAIWKAGVVPRGKRGTDTIDLSSSWHTEGTFERCTFITFVLSLRKASGIGTFTAFVRG